ncbi:MAG: chloride channel protein [Proteobacteria bacterium]|nr:chloride channel protein [Pseudomonadota bacterium]
MPGSISVTARLADRIGRLATRPIFYGLAVGLLSGLVAVLFFVGLEFASHYTFGTLTGMPQPVPPGDDVFPAGSVAEAPRRWLYFWLPAIGGLLSGVLVYWLAPETEGHGTDAVLAAFHRGRGRVRARVPWVKGAATILTLSSGGSAGKEGPIAQIGAGLGSWLAERLRLGVRERRILLLAGMAGGLGAIFRAPLGSAITAIEVLYREDFESDALITCVISSVTAYVLFILLLGGERIFLVPAFSVVTPIEMPGFLLLALVTVPVGRLYIGVFYATRNRIFRRLPVPRFVRPALGGLGVGMIGLWVPEVYGAGWGYIQEALNGNLALGVIVGILVAKIAATSFTIGSGGSGGVFGPTLFIGGMLGGAIGYGGQLIAPELFPHPAAYVLVGMASFFAGVASAPIGAMLMVTEMSGGYALLPPLMLVSVVAILLMRQTSIYENQFKNRFQSPAHVGNLTINVLEEMKVSDVFSAGDPPPTVGPSTRFDALRQLILVSPEATIPVIAENGSLSGLVTAEQLRPLMDERRLGAVVVAGDIAAQPVYVLPDDDLYRAHELFHGSGCPQIPVMEPPDGDAEPSRIIGMLDYRDMMQAYGRELSRRREV